MNIAKRSKEFFTNKHSDIIIWQMPNFLLWAWIVIKAISLVLSDDSLKSHLSQLSRAVIFAWAYLEITKGDSPFRRVLGLVVMVLTVIGFFA